MDAEWSMRATTAPQRQSSNPSLENDEQQSEDSVLVQKQQQQQKLPQEREERTKNEVLKTEDIKQNLQKTDHEMIEIIKQQDKYVQEMQDEIQGYEKLIAEIISAAEQDKMKYQKKIDEVRADRDCHYYNITLLERSISELKVEHEKSKDMTLQLKEQEDSLLAEIKHYLGHLVLQKQRYDKIKNHTMQLEMAIKKLESLEKQHAAELSNMLLKKEEISLECSSIKEQLKQKTLEIAKLVKILNELLNRQD